MRGQLRTFSDEVAALPRLFEHLRVQAVQRWIVGLQQTGTFGLAVATRAHAGKPPYVRLRLALPAGPWRDLTSE